ncbi:hypothetical protein NIES4071_106390 (plasmid) [Calothrix sp. NIES-4071]|nr:hypothetical protein NIES4071_106390 [Calothrix sp. NIES-4071]BAZ65057.1 hypothetical protein NIES4105_107900 [Calothrix sp. NIES-4105]
MVKQFSLPPGYQIRKLSKNFLDFLWYGTSEVYIAEYRNEEIGRIVFVDTGSKYLIHVVHVSPRHRRKKIGSYLVQTVVQLADKPIYLSTLSAKDFYTRLGFTIEHQQEIFGFIYGYIMVLQPTTQTNL